MMTNHELARVRRQMQRRLRVVLAQRRIAAAHYPARRLAEPAAAPPASTQPASEH